jgi:hypothetical protein
MMNGCAMYSVYSSITAILVEEKYNCEQVLEKVLYGVALNFWRENIKFGL